MGRTIEKTWDDQRLKADRLKQLQPEMRRRGIGAMYLTDNVSVRYVLNLKVPGGEVFVPVEGEPTAFIRPRDLGFVKPHHPNARPPLYQRAATRDGTNPEETNRFVHGILDLMASHGVAGETLAADILGIEAILAFDRSGVRLADARPVLERTSSVKTDDEIAIYRCIVEQYAHTFRAFRDAIRPGVTENELAGTVVSSWYEAGGEDIAQLNVCSGQNMNPWRRWPTQRALQEGEFVGVDLHGRGINGLRGDASRTFFVGSRPSPELRDLYRRAYDHLRGSIDTVEGGRSFADLVRLAPEVPEKYHHHLYNLNIVHGVGLGSSGYPHIEKRKKPPDDMLKPNQILAVECYFGEVGDFPAVKLEEHILVREGKPEILGSDIPYDDRLL
jgi:Xaa-Pro aminopeptidase